MLTVTLCGASDQHQGTNPWVTRGSVSDRYKVVDSYASEQAAHCVM